MSREIHIPSAVYVTRFLNSVGEWIKGVYLTENLQQSLNLDYQIHSTQFENKQFHTLSLHLLPNNSSVSNRNTEYEAEIGSITIEHDIGVEISAANLRNAQFSYIKTDFQWMNAQQPGHAFWEDLRNLPIQYVTPILNGVDLSQWPQHVGTPFIDGNYLTDCVNKYMEIYGNADLRGRHATLNLRKQGSAGAWLSMERLIDLLNTTGITQL